MDLQLLRPASTVTYLLCTFYYATLRVASILQSKFSVGLWTNLEKERLFVLAIPAKTSFKALAST